MTQSDSYLRRILLRTKCIALIGVSPNPIRPSHFVGRYLSMRGYRVVPVNPTRAGETLFGERIHRSIEDIPADLRVDMIDIFRRSEYVPQIVNAAIRNLPGLRTIWMQIGVRNTAAAESASAAGLDVIQDLCPKMEHQRLFGELRKAGFNTGVISSKL
ncbi:MAG: CoA-binding protein [Rhodobacter sp.]|nr:CoA-binding protein [Rhodobacter sp.]MCY4167494.1 CoA-binding protein [Rhodobacter sp.]MCY4241351.1 CoA-binding protein [Rhodobacter sp.]